MTDFISEASLLALWNEATSHESLVSAVAAMAAHVRGNWAFGRLLVRGFDRVSATTVTLADSAASVPAMERVPCPPSAFEHLRLWAAQRQTLTRVELSRLDAAITRAFPASCGDDCLVAGLAGAHEVCGLLIAEPGAGQSFTENDRRQFASLLDPFAAALATHERMRELAALRDAAEAERERLLSRLGGAENQDAVIGIDGGLAAVFARIALVSKSALPVLILGETGTGKEVVAREIHQRSPRQAAPIIRVNCGAIPPELIDSELFGHERGSFTGATAQRRGWFERANGGTLLLDEIGDLPHAAQVRLLRVLQDGLIQRVGGDDDVAVDVRIIAATHRDLPLMIQEGHFREDLWYRLATFPIVLPPLRERRSDVPALARHFARRAASRFGLRLQLPTANDLLVLSAYDWPGNVRELAAVLERAAILGDGQPLDVVTALGATAAPSSARPVARPRGPESAPLLTLDDAIRRHIEAALAATAGRIEGRHGAAPLLAVNPHTLRARMRKLGIDWRRFHPPATDDARTPR